MELQKVGHDWATLLSFFLSLCIFYLQCMDSEPLIRKNFLNVKVCLFSFLSIQETSILFSWFLLPSLFQTLIFTLQSCHSHNTLDYFVLQSICSYRLFTRRTHLLLICIVNHPYETNSDKLTCLSYEGFPILQHSNIKRMERFFLWDCFSHSCIYHMLFVKIHDLIDCNFPSSQNYSFIHACTW